MFFLFSHLRVTLCPLLDGVLKELILSFETIALFDEMLVAHRREFSLIRWLLVHQLFDLSDRDVKRERQGKRIDLLLHSADRWSVAVRSLAR